MFLLVTVFSLRISVFSVASTYLRAIKHLPVDDDNIIDRDSLYLISPSIIVFFFWPEGFINLFTHTRCLVNISDHFLFFLKKKKHICKVKSMKTFITVSPSRFFSPRKSHHGAVDIFTFDFSLLVTQQGKYLAVVVLASSLI